MAKLWSTEDLLGWDERDLLVWYSRMNHCTLNLLIRLLKRGIIPRKLINIRKLTPCVAFLFGKLRKKPLRNKGKHSGGSIRKTS